MIFKILLEFVLSVSVEQYIFLCQVLNFIRSKIDIVFFNSSNVTGFQTWFWFFSHVVDNPIDMKVLNATHYGLDEMKHNFSLSIFVSSEYSPNLSQ